MSIRIEQFIWLPDIIDKLLTKHQVTPEEAEQIFFNRPRYRRLEKGAFAVKTCTPLWGKLMLDGI